MLNYVGIILQDIIIYFVKINSNGMYVTM